MKMFHNLLSSRKIDFENDKIGSLLFRVSLPPITVALITCIVNFFSSSIVASIHIDYLTAYSISSPFCLSIVTTLYVGITNGVAALSGRNINDKEKINNILFNAFFLLILFMLFYVVIEILFARKFVCLFTTNESIIDISTKFIYVHSIASIMYAFSQVMVGTLQAMGDSTVPSIISLASVPITFFLNLVTVNGYFGVKKFGLFGLTITSITVSCITIICYVFRLLSHNIHIFKNTKLKRVYLKELIHISIPVMFQQFFATALVSGYNLIVKSLSESAIAVMGIFYNWSSIVQATRLQFPIFSVIGSNITAKKYDRVKKAIRCSIHYTILVSLIMTAFMEFFPEFCLKIFNLPDSEMIIGVKIFRILTAYALPMMLFTILCHIAIVLGNSKVGFVALLVQTSFTLIGGALFNKINDTLSIVAFPAAAYFALFTVLWLILKSKSPQMKMLKESFKA